MRARRPPGLAGRGPRQPRGADGLSHEEEIDRRVLLGVIDELRFEEEELDEPSWSAITYSYLLGGGLFALLSREFAPLPDRLASAAGRMEGIAAVLDAARANLTSGRGREVGTFHVEKAIATMPGVADLCRTAAEMAADARRHGAPRARRGGRRRRRPPRSTPSSSGCATSCCRAPTATSGSAATSTSASSRTR